MGTHRFVIEGTEYEVNVGRRAGKSVQVSVNGRAYDVNLLEAEPAERPAAPMAPRAAHVPRAVADAGSGAMRAPISGVVLRINVTVGQRVTRGTVMLILEAMKMENEILAGADGVVKSLDVKPQQDVREGDVLLVIE